MTYPEIIQRIQKPVLNGKGCFAVTLIKIESRCVCMSVSLPTNVRSSRPEVFCIKGVLINLTKFTGKHP